MGHARWGGFPTAGMHVCVCVCVHIWLRESYQDHWHARYTFNIYLLGIGTNALSYFGLQKLLFQT